MTIIDVFRRAADDLEKHHKMGALICSSQTMFRLKDELEPQVRRALGGAQEGAFRLSTFEGHPVLVLRGVPDGVVIPADRDWLECAASALGDELWIRLARNAPRAKLREFADGVMEGLASSSRE